MSRAAPDPSVPSRRTGPDGTVWSADDLARVTATNLHREFATVTTTRDLVEAH